MTTLAEVEAAALALPKEDQLSLLARLTEHDVGSPPGPNAAGDLAKLAADRWAAYRRGELAASDWREVIGRMREADRRRVESPVREAVEAPRELEAAGVA